MSKRRLSRASFSVEDVRFMLSSPVYGYGINLLPAERAAEAVMQLNMRLAQEMRDSGKAFTLEELDQRFQVLFHELETSGACTRGADGPPLVTKEQWLHAQLKTIEKLSRGETL
jgi:hypothetical protein